jgi:hypothetical protein
VQDRNRVVADRRQSDSELLKVLPAMLQFDQLAFAERSPIGRAEEDQRRAVRA